MTDQSTGAPAVQTPKMRFLWDFSIGNVLQMALLIGGAIAAYFGIVRQVETSSEAVKQIPSIVLRLTALETSQALTTQSLTTNQNSLVTFQSQMTEAIKSINSDRKDQQAVNSEVLQKLAGIIARLDERGMTTGRYVLPQPVTMGYN